MKFETLEVVKLKHVLSVLAHHGGNRTHAAKTLGVCYRNMSKLIKKAVLLDLHVGYEKSIGLSCQDSSEVQKIEPGDVVARDDDDPFPTNEERLRYIDDIASRDRL